MTSPRDIPTCGECGQRHVRTGRNGTGQTFEAIACAGHVKTDRSTYVKGQDRKKLDKPRPCQGTPMRGQTKCMSHGGRSPQAKAAASRRLATQAIQADAAALLASEGLEGVTDPIAMIGQLAVEALALKTAAGARVNARGIVRNVNHKGDAHLEPEAELYERSLDRSMRFLEIVVKHTRDQDVDDAKAMLAKLGEFLGVEQ